MGDWKSIDIIGTVFMCISFLSMSDTFEVNTKANENSIYLDYLWDKIELYSVFVSYPFIFLPI